MLTESHSSHSVRNIRDRIWSIEVIRKSKTGRIDSVWADF